MATLEATPIKSAPVEPLSLTKAAEAVDVATSTLRRAIRNGKLKASKTSEGHYEIAIDQLMQYQANETATGATPRATRPAAPHGANAAAPHVDTGATPVAAESTTAVATGVYQARVAGLETEVRLHKDSIRRLEGEVDSWKSQAENWRKHADNSLRLLEDQRETLNQKPDIDLSPEEGSRAWLYVLVGCGLVAAGFVFHDELVMLWERVSAQ